jgi:hypothetical protein
LTRASTGAPGRFGYLFPGLKDRQECLLPYGADGELDPHIVGLLKALAAEMESPVAGDEQSRIPAGITYLGQFIVHDISFDASRSVTHVIDAEKIENLRSPRLHLESLYGRGPLDQPYLYERVAGSDIAGARLLLGHRLNAKDLPRDIEGRGTGRALVGDPRNDDNMLVSQLHLAFASFHNAVVARLSPRIADPYELFVATSAEVRRHYQWIVVHEFLPTIADPAVVDEVLASPCNHFCGARGAYMPAEFSIGAFRFGHSMVRPFYTIRPGQLVSLDHMRRLYTFRNPLTAGVPVGWVVDWSQFFSTDGNARPAANVALKIDTHVTRGLPTELSLLRAYAAQIASGQCLAAAMGVPTLTHAQLLGAEVKSVLREHAGILLERTPLWYYVLKEAEVLAGGERLGPLGSRLVAEVLINLLRADPQSILSTPLWRPTFGRRSGEFTMLDLLCVGRSISPCRETSELTGKELANERR